MTRAGQLHELQEADLEIQRKREALERLEGQLGEDGGLAEAQTQLREEKKHLAHLEEEQRAAEWELEDMGAKVASLEKKLYGGSVANPRELKSLQEEVEHLKGRQRKQEDHVLDLMGEVEIARGKVKALADQVKKSEVEGQEKRGQLLGEKEELTLGLAQSEKRRQELSSLIDPPDLYLYEELRAAKQGRAVARVERGMCQGCRINLSARELQEARSGQALVPCSNCGRLLYAG